MSEKKITATKDFVTTGIAATLEAAKTYSDDQDKAMLTDAKAYSDEVGKAVTSSVKLYADEVGKTATTDAKSYTDTEIGKIKTPTKVSELENDGVYFTSDKVFGVPVYDTTGEVVSVHLQVPYKSEAGDPPHALDTFPANIPTQGHVEEKIEAAVENRLRYRGTVATFNDLPTDATACDICKVTETGSKYIYIDSKWQKIEEVDLSAYVKSSEVMNYVPKASGEVFGVVKASIIGSLGGSVVETVIDNDGCLRGYLKEASVDHSGGVKLSHSSLPSGKVKYGTFTEGHTLYAFGDSSSGFDPNTKSIVIGLDARNYSGHAAVAVGFGATVGSAPHGIAIGTNVSTYNSGITIGYKVLNRGEAGIAIGREAQSSHRSVAIGNNTLGTGDQSVAIGHIANTNGQPNSVAIGSCSKASGEAAVAIGYDTCASHRSTAIGYNAFANEEDAIAFAPNEHKIYLNSTSSSYGAHAVSLTNVIKKYAGKSSTIAYGWHSDTTTIDLTEHEVYWSDLLVSNSVTIKLPDFTDVTKYYPCKATIPSRRVLTIRFNNANSKIDSFDNPSHTFYPRYEEDGTEEKDITNETFGVMDKVVIEFIPLGSINGSDQEWFVRWSKVSA